MNLKDIWYSNEALVARYFEDKWWKILHQNRAMRWWEIDLVVKHKNDLIFVEVKTIDYTDDIHWYITQSKIKALQRSINTYMQEYETSYKNMRLVFVFVKDRKIIDIFEYEW